MSAKTARCVSVLWVGKTGQVTFLGSTEKSTVFLQAKVDLYQICAGKELHDHSTRNDWADAEFHERTAIGREDDTHPVEWIGRVGGHDTIERDLRTDQED